MHAYQYFFDYHTVEKFHNFVLEQAFHSFNFASCVLVFRVCIVILTITRINFREFGQIVKYKPRKNFPLYSKYVNLQDAITCVNSFVTICV